MKNYFMDQIGLLKKRKIYIDCVKYNIIQLTIPLIGDQY